ncbi:MAG TPA: SHOCT domain-containing protein [Mycobacteriales bacterium]|nr:SHOCT domain-containing protein [Mycobacteriales bacterium]
MSRRRHRIAHALAHAQESARSDVAAVIDETAARLDRLAALRTAGLISEEEFHARLAELTEPAASSEPGQLG